MRLEVYSEAVPCGAMCVQRIQIYFQEQSNICNPSMQVESKKVRTSLVVQWLRQLPSVEVTVSYSETESDEIIKRENKRK